MFRVNNRDFKVASIGIFLVSLLLTFSVSNTFFERVFFLVDFEHVFAKGDTFIFTISFWWLFCQQISLLNLFFLLLTCLVARIQRRIHNLIKYLRWRFLLKHFKVQLRCLTRFWIIMSKGFHSGNLERYL